MGVIFPDARLSVAPMPKGSTRDLFETFKFWTAASGLRLSPSQKYIPVRVLTLELLLTITYRLAERYGCNPTGATTSLAHRQEVLDISQSHNILILEDSRSRFFSHKTNIHR